MRTPPRPPAARGGFTLIELLVAAALSLVVMTILAFAFQTGMGTLSQLKSVAGLAEQLRAAEDTLRRDLAANHLESDRGDPVRLSRLDPTEKPARGYVRVAQYSRPVQPYNPANDPASPFAFPPSSYRFGIEYDAAQLGPTGYRYWVEGNDDPTQIPALTSYRATDHILQLTVQLPGRAADEVFYASLPEKLWEQNWPAQNGNPVLAASLPGFDPTGRKFVSRWAEVSYHLEPNGVVTVDGTDPNDPTATAAPQLPVYALIRRQRLLAPPGSTILVPPTIPAGPYPSANQPLTVADLLASPDLALSVPNPPTEPNYVLISPDTNALGFMTRDTPNGLDMRAVYRIGGLLDPLGARAVPATDPRLDRPYKIPDGSAEYGSDVLLNNVISMQVRMLVNYDRAMLSFLASNNIAPAAVQAMLAADNQFVDPPLNSLPTTPPPPAPAVTPPINSVPRNSLSDRGMIPPRQTGDTVRPVVLGGGFDTAVIREVQVPDNNGNPIYVPYSIRAIQIKLRVYDPKNRLTRQMTIAQDL